MLAAVRVLRAATVVRSGKAIRAATVVRSGKALRAATVVRSGKALRAATVVRSGKGLRASAAKEVEEGWAADESGHGTDGNLGMDASGQNAHEQVARDERRSAAKGRER